MKEKKLNAFIIAIAAIALCIIGVASVIAIKAGRSGDAAPESKAESVTAFAEEQASSVFEEITELTAEVISGTALSENIKAPETKAAAAPGKTEKQTVAPETTVPVTEVINGANVPTLNEDELSKGKSSPSPTPTNNDELPGDMSFAGLYRSGNNVIGLKEYIYNNDMSPNCTQRKFGYNKMYDWGAQLIDFSIDTTRLKFNYDSKDYMIQLWKGQYISGDLGTVGGEVGVYTRPEGKSAANSHYNCAGTEDELFMEMTIFWDENQNGVYLPQFTRNYSRHWWQTGYVDGQLPNIKDSNPLRLLSHITFKDEEQANAFAGALTKNGFKAVDSFSHESPDTFKISGRDVIFLWQYVR